MNTFRKFEQWVENNPVKYHLYTKTPALVLVLVFLYMVD